MVCACVVSAEFSPGVLCEAIFGAAFYLSGRLNPGYVYPRLGAVWVLFIHCFADGSMDGWRDGC